MDNYFTLVKTMIGTRKCGVAVMGTARARYVLDEVNVCVCVSLIETNTLFVLLLEPTGLLQSLVSMHSMTNNTTHGITWMIQPATFECSGGSIIMLLRWYRTSTWEQRMRLSSVLERNHGLMNSIENISVLFGVMIMSSQSRYHRLWMIIITGCWVLILLINSLHTIDQKFVADKHGCLSSYTEQVLLKWTHNMFCTRKHRTYILL